VGGVGKSGTIVSSIICFIFCVAGSVQADGMLPETTVIILEEEDGEASINIKNSDATPALLYSSIENIPEDLESFLVVTPPITRLDPGERQLVRFISQLKEPLKTQRLKRVAFEGLPERKNADTATVGVTIRQNLPLIMHPKGLARNHKPWTLLKWSQGGGHLRIENDSPYVVRMAQDVLLLPQKRLVDIGRTYVLPGETLSKKFDVGLEGTTSVRFSPATVYGFTVASHDAQVVVETP
jgi:P pilus assembly chaperone PapD